MVTLQATIESFKATFPAAKGDIRMNDPGHKPTPLRILKFTKYLRQCAISITNSKSDLGYLGIVVPPETYQPLNDNVPYSPPTDPGSAPTITEPTGSSSSVSRQLLQHQTALKLHETAKHDWTLFKAATTALRNLIIQHIDDEYIASLDHSITGFTLVSPLTLITYIRTNYGMVDETDLKNNDTALSQPWDHTTPIQQLYNRMEECQLYAEAGDEPISDKRLMRHTLQAIRDTGLYNTACDEWNDTAPTEKTWINFKLFFIKKNNNLEKHTTGTTGFSSTDVTNALVDVTSTLQAYRHEIDTLKQQLDQQSPSPPAPSATPAPAPVNATLSTEQLTQLLQAINATSTSPICLPVSTAPTSTTTPPPNRDPRIQAYNDKGYPVTYCWSCGITGNLSHTSATCKNPLPGHDKTATYHDRKGGTNKTRKQVYEDKKKNKS